MKCCHGDHLDDTLLEQLNGFKQCGVVMVATNGTSKSQHVTEVCHISNDELFINAFVNQLLQQNNWPVVNLDCPFTSASQTTIFGIAYLVALNCIVHVVIYTLLFTVTTTARLLSLSAVQLPVVNHLILYMLSNTKNEFKRTLATLYPAVKAKLVSCQ